MGRTSAAIAEEGAHRVEEARDDATRLARTAYAYAHAIMVLGVIVTAVGDEEVILHPTGDMETAVALVVLGGPAIYLAGDALFLRMVSGRVPGSRLLAVAALALLGLVAPVVNPLTLAIAATLVLAGLVASDAWVRLSPPAPPRAGDPAVEVVDAGVHVPADPCPRRSRRAGGGHQAAHEPDRLRVVEPLGADEGGPGREGDRVAEGRPDVAASATALAAAAQERVAQRTQAGPESARHQLGHHRNDRLVAQQVGEHLLRPPVVRVELGQRLAEPGVGVGDGRPGRRVGGRVGRPPVAAAREEQRPLVGEVPVDGRALHAGALRHGRHRGARRPERAVQLHRGLGDAQPSLLLELGAAAHTVRPLRIFV